MYPSDEAVKARKEMGAVASSALSQLSSLDDILGIGPMKSPPRDQVVPSRDDVIRKQTVNVSMVQSSERTQEVCLSICLSLFVCVCVCVCVSVCVCVCVL